MHQNTYEISLHHYNKLQVIMRRTKTISRMGAAVVSL